MNNKDIFNIAMAQSAIDSNYNAQDFKCTENKVVISQKTINARRYLDLPFLCDLTSYGNNIVASVSLPLKEVASDYIARFSAEHCFETPNIHVLINALKPFNLNVCFMAEYFLPDVDALNRLTCGYESKLYNSGCKFLFGLHCKNHCD